MAEAIAAAGAFLKTVAIPAAVAGMDITVGNLMMAALTVGTALDARAGAKSSAARARRQFNASQQDRAVMFQSATAPRTVVYGQAHVSGPVIYAQSTGTKREFLHIVVPVAGHEIDSFVEFRLNNETLPTPDVSGFVTSGNFVKSVTLTTQQDSTSTSIALSNTPTKVTGVTWAAGTGEDVTYGTLAEGTGWSLSGSTVSILTPPGGSPTYTVNYEYAGPPLKRVRIRGYTGAAGQAADADLVAESGGKWTSAHRGDGVAYIYARLEFDQEIFGQIGLPNISAVIKGKKVLDTRTSTTAWSDNPALCTADYLRNGTYGLGCTSAEVPSAEISAAANICDELVTITSGGATQKRYTCNGVLSTDQQQRANLEALVDSMAGSAVWVQGRFLVRAGAHETPALTITADMLAGSGVRFMPFARKRERFNAVEGTFVDPAQGYAERQFPSVENATYLAQDNGWRQTAELQLPLTHDELTAQRLGKITLERARLALKVMLSCNLYAYDLAPGDVVALTLARYGWTSKQFTVLEREISFETMTVQLTLQETASAVWSWAYGEATTTDLAPNTDLPDPTGAIPAITGLAAASGSTHVQRLSDGTFVNRVLLSWTAATGAWVADGGQVQVEFKRDTDTQWQALPPVAGGATSAYVSPVDAGRPVVLRVRPVNARGRSGPWATVAHVVQGDTNPPENVAGLAAAAVVGGQRISWTACVAADYLETELRYGASWGAGTLIWVGKGSAHTWVPPGDASYTLWAAHRDFSGNDGTPQSLSTSYVKQVPDVQIHEPGSVTVTGEHHTPDGFNTGWNTQVATVSFTPKVSGVATVYFDGQGDFTAAASPAGAHQGRWSIQDDNATWNNNARIVSAVQASATAKFPVQSTRQFNVTAGVACSFSLWASKFDAADAFVVSNGVLRVEVVPTV